jgi:(E)-4-hydroxy-3-methylbut-2-enyl-diphosphate synthase
MRLNPGLPAYQRRRTRVVMIGDVGVGGDNPIRVQSMTTPATTDTAATVAQIERLVDAGCEIVRVTVPTSHDADNLPRIREELAARGIRVPLVADIHFTPAAAMRSVPYVDKIRVNPGNFADKKKFARRDYTDTEYTEELGRIHAAFTPLVRRCKEEGVAMRIGTNHGSLSDRIMNRFGDTPLGMVESALEFVRICEDSGYRELVLSMKASNPLVVLDAYRLLVRRMAEEGMDYPLHLGVTEAGDGEDGRIKSALGIGVLLEEGIGDTVRVSLTEDPVAEIPVAFTLVAPYNANFALAGPPSGTWRAVTFGWNDPPTAYERRAGTVRVETPIRSRLSDLDAVRREIDEEAGPLVPVESRADVVSVELAQASEIPAVAALSASMTLVAPRVALSVRVVPPVRDTLDPAGWDRLFEAAHRVHVPLPGPDGEPLLSALLDRAARGRGSLLVEATSRRGRARDAMDLGVEIARRALGPARVMLALDPALDLTPLLAYRRLASRIAEACGGIPLELLLLDRPGARGADEVLGPASALGGLLCQGLGEAIQVDGGSAADARRIGFNILQAARVRISKTEFISCPSCGRTLFDLETTTAAIKARTAHLKGLKIAVMGCVVNGPGEMADADFGYVGWGDEKIALFVGNQMVERDIPSADAAERLVDLIKREGKWVEKGTVT